MQHPDENLLLRYVLERVSDEEQLQTDAHLADCPECVQRVQALRYLRRDFANVWKSWTAAEHGRQFRQWQLIKGLHAIADAKPSLASQVRQWLEAIRAEVEIGLQVLIDRGHEVASLAHGVLPPDCRFRLYPAYVGVGTPEAQKALQNHLEKSSLLLSENRGAEAVEELLAAVGIDARRPQSASSEVWQGGRRVLQSAVDGHGTLWVKWWPAAGQSPPTLAVLLPHHPQGQALAVAFEAVEEDSYLLTEFREVPEGFYTLRLGPISRPG
jgi:hypothetical protein